MVIPNFSKYEASNLGRLRSLNYKRTGKVKVLKPADSGGYLKTMLQNDNGNYKSFTVHYFICLAFLGPRDIDKQVNHIDGNKYNNAILNLEYCTVKENVKHAWDNGLCIPNKGESNGMAKLSEENVIEIRRIANSSGRYYGRKELAIRFGVSECCIKEVVNKRKGLWSHV